MSYEERIEVLKEIKYECERKKCRRCSFYYKDLKMCILNGKGPYGWLLPSEKEIKGKTMTKTEHDKIINLMKHGALQGIDTCRLDGKCEDVIPLDDAIAIVDKIYRAESEDK